MANILTDFLRSNLTKQGRYQKQQDSIRKRNDEFLKYMTQSIFGDPYGSYSGKKYRHDRDIFQPRDRLTYHVRNQLHVECSILRSTIDKKNKEINRNGFHTKKKFTRKCMRVHIEPCENPIHDIQQIKGEDIKPCPRCPDKDLPLGQKGCEEEFQTDRVRCEFCRSATRPPNIDHKQILDRARSGYVNKAKHTFGQIIAHSRLDIEKHDNGFIIAEFLYTLDDKSNKPIKKHLIQMYRADPARIRPIHAITGDLTSHYYTCIRHRTVYQSFNMSRFQYGKIPRCANNIDDVLCNEPLQAVEYVEIETEVDTTPIYCFIPGEVHHAKEYHPAGAMGVSLMDSLFYTILQIIGQEKWIAEYYLKRRMFKGIVQMPQGIAGGYKDNEQTKIDQEMAMFREDPDYIPFFGVPKDSKDLKYIRIDDSPKELQYTDSRSEARRQVTSAWGMSNVWMGDVSVGSGLNNQGLELTVSNRQIAVGQDTMNTQILLPLSASIINCDIHEAEYYYEYKQHEEQDIMAEKERNALDIANHMQLQGMGFEILMDSENQLYARPPVDGMPVTPGGEEEMPSVPGQDQGKKDPVREEEERDEEGRFGSSGGKPFENVEGMNEGGQSYEVRARAKPFQGAPAEPQPKASGLANKSYLSKMYDDIVKCNIEEKGMTIHSDYFGWLKPILLESKGQPVKTFDVERRHDASGISGTGKVMTGIIFGDGTTAVRWNTDYPSISIFESMDDFFNVHIAPHPENESIITYRGGNAFEIFNNNEHTVESGHGTAQIIKSEIIIEKRSCVSEWISRLHDEGVGEGQKWDSHEQIVAVAHKKCGLSKDDEIEYNRYPMDECEKCSTIAKGQEFEGKHPRDKGGKFSEKGEAKEAPEEKKAEPKAEPKSLDQVREEVVQLTKNNLDVLGKMQNGDKKRLEKMKSEYERDWNELSAMKRAGAVEQNMDEYRRLEDSLYKLGFEEREVSAKMHKRQMRIKNESEKLNDPDKLLADRLYPTEKRYKQLQQLLDDPALKNLEENIAFHEREYPKVVEAWEKKDPKIWAEDAWEDYLDASNGDEKKAHKDAMQDLREEKKWFEDNAIIHESQKETKEEYERELVELEPRYNALKDLPIRKDGYLWGYYNNNEMRGVDEVHNTPDIDHRDVNELVQKETKWIAERLGIDLENHSFKNVNLEMHGGGFDNPNVLAYVNYGDNTIAFNAERIAASGSNAALQNVIRHELAHYFEQAKQFPNIPNDMKEYEKLNQKFYRKKGLTAEESERSMDLEDKLQKFRNFRIASHHHSEERFSKGHGDAWQDTMEILYGKKPTGRSIGDHDIPEVGK